MLELHQLDERRVVNVRLEIALRVSESLKVFDGNVYTTARNVFLQVSQYVGQLQRQPQIDRVLACARRFVAEYLNRNQPDSRSDAVAILAQVCECLIALPLEVHLHSV